MKNKKWWLFAFGFCFLLATLSPLASSSPDGLEYVAEEEGFVDMERSSPLSIIADYVFPSIENEALATISAGWIGTTIMFILAYGVTWLVLRARGAKSLIKTD